jgi:hypothetical protein
MKRFGLTALAATLATAATVQVATAQLPGIPYGPVNTGTGISVAADFGKPTSGGGSAMGVSGGLGFSSFGISASVGSLKPSGGSSITTFAGMAGMKLIGGGLLPLTIGAQVGGYHYSLAGAGITAVMPGVWIKVTPPLFPLKPWAQVYYQTGSCGAGCTFNNEARITIGANFNLLLGLGLHAGYDMGTKSGSLKGWGVGAHFNFRVPSL